MHQTSQKIKNYLSVSRSEAAKQAGSQRSRGLCGAGSSGGSGVLGVRDGIDEERLVRRPTADWGTGGRSIKCGFCMLPILE